MDLRLRPSRRVFRVMGSVPGFTKEAYQPEGAEGAKFPRSYAYNNYRRLELNVVLAPHAHLSSCFFLTPTSTSCHLDRKLKTDALT